MPTPDDLAPHGRAHHARTPWTTESTRPVYANPWIRVREDVARLPDGRATIYICENYLCRLPTTDPEVAARLLDGHGIARPGG